MVEAVKILLRMSLSFFGGGGGGGFGRGGGRGGSQRGGFHNALQLGRQQVGNTPMNNREQNRQTRDVANRLGLNEDQRDRLHDLVHGQGWGYQRILQEAREYFGID